MASPAGEECSEVSSGEPDTHAGLPVPRRRIAIAALSLGVTVLVIDTNIANVALPTIAQSLHVEASAITSIITVYQLVLVMGLFPFASLADRLTLRRMFQLGMVLFALASGFAFLARSLPLLLILRAMQGIGAGMAMSVTTAMIREIYPSNKLGVGLGLNALVLAAAGSIAPTLGGFVVSHMAWQWIFAAAAPVALLSLALSGSLPETQPHLRPINVPALAGSSITLLLLIGGIQLATHGVDPVFGIAVSCVGLGLAIMLARYENRQEHPVIPVDILKLPHTGRLSLASILAFLANTLMLITMPFLLERRFGFPPTTTGLLLLSIPLTLMVVTPLAAALTDRAPGKQIGLVGLSVMLGGLWALASMPDNSGKIGIAVRLSITAAGFALFSPQNSRQIIESAPRHRSAAAGGLVSTSRLFGQTFAGALAGVIFAIGTADGNLPFFAAMVFVVLAGLCIVRPGAWVRKQR